MWHKPQLMTAVADLLFAAAAAALLVAAAVWFARMPFFTLSEVVVTQELKEVKRSDVERALSGLLRGNFFSINLDTLRQSLEQISWVRHADVRRRWPARLEVRLEEHEPAARWGESGSQLLNTHGEVFSAVLANEMPLPVLYGPASSAPEVLQHYEDFVAALRPTGHSPQQLTLSPRLAWQVRLDDGMLVELGREQQKAPVNQRLARFVEFYPAVLAGRRPRPTVVDMRYPNGFALRFAAAPGNEGKGKQ